MNWPIVELQEVCKTGSGTTPPRNRPELYEGCIPWVKSGELRENEILETEEHISEVALNTTSLKMVPAGAILVAMYGATVGRVGLLGIDATTNQAVCHVIPDPKKVDRRYMFHLLQARAQELVGRGVGGAQPNISQGTIKQLKIPLPPLDDQRRIAAILDQADTLRRLRTRALGKLNTLGHALFHEMFGDPATNPKGWPMGVIGDLLKEAKYGSSGKANSEGRGLPMLRMGNVTYDGRIDLSDLKHIELSDKEFNKYTTRPGDLLFNRTNSKELVGKTAVVTQAKPMAIAGYLVRGRANARGNTHYISGYLNSTHGKAVLRNMCKNIVGMANINAKEFQSIPIAIPPVELQRAYAEKLMSLRAEEAQFQASLDIASTLFASLQHRAFKGEL